MVELSVGIWPSFDSLRSSLAAEQLMDPVFVREKIEGENLKKVEALVTLMAAAAMAQAVGSCKTRRPKMMSSNPVGLHFYKLSHLV